MGMEEEKRMPIIPLPQRRRMDHVINGFGQKRRMDEENSNGSQNKASRPSVEDNPMLSLPSYLQVQVAQPDLSLVDDNEIASSSNAGEQQMLSEQIGAAKQDYQRDVNG